MRGNPFIQRLVRADWVGWSYLVFAALHALLAMLFAFAGLLWEALGHGLLTLVMAGCFAFVQLTAAEGFLTQPAGRRAGAEPESW